MSGSTGPRGLVRNHHRGSRKAITITISGVLKSRCIIYTVPEAKKASAVKCTLTGPIAASCPESVLRSRWSGLLGVFAGLVMVPVPLIAGLIWWHLGPAYVFIIPLALDFALRVPLLTTIAETLWKQNK